MCAFNYVISSYFIERGFEERLSGSAYIVEPMAVLYASDVKSIKTFDSDKISSIENKIELYRNRLKLNVLSIIFPAGPAQTGFITIMPDRVDYSSISRPEFNEALKTKILTVSKNYRAENRDMMKYAYLPVENSAGETIAVIETGIDLNHFLPLQIAVLISALLFIGLSASSGLILRRLLERTIIKPVIELSRNTTLVAAGDLEHLININSNNEIGDLATNFNKMTQNLRDSFDKIESSNKNLMNQLLTDSLTNMPNRKKFMDDLAVSENPVVIIFNIDSFQEINDFYGTEAGDMILKELANRLRFMNLGISYRLYKMHADEYTLLIERTAGLNELDHWGILLSEEVMERPFIYKDTEIYITVSLGIGISQQSLSAGIGSAIEIGREALRNADMALKRAKVSRKKYVVYQEYMEIAKEYENNIQWTKKLKSAIKDDRIVPYFQPILNNLTGKIEKYECLMRMIDENGKIIAPLNFLNTAKKARLYRYLTKMILEKSFEFFKDKNYEFSLNISLEDIMDEKTVGYIYDLINASKGSASRAVFELLETENVENYAEVIEFIKEVKQSGCKIAIDDFGTGYSNFSHLIHMQIDYIKIDASLIKNINKDLNSQVITRTIASFARELGLKTISEYVHSKEVFDKCLEIGIDYSQGYYLGEPKEHLVEI
jgi:diguanylate cyclase (GGDEF)-like protein